MKRHREDGGPREGIPTASRLQRMLGHRTGSRRETFPDLSIVLGRAWRVVNTMGKSEKMGCIDHKVDMVYGNGRILKQLGALSIGYGVLFGISSRILEV